MGKSNTLHWAGTLMCVMAVACGVAACSGPEAEDRHQDNAGAAHTLPAAKDMKGCHSCGSPTVDDDFLDTIPASIPDVPAEALEKPSRGGVVLAPYNPGEWGRLAGRRIAIDPGHNGANGQHPEIINAQVPAGNGRTKNCNTTGTQNGDLTEHEFNWDVGYRLAHILRRQGAEVVMTRPSGDGVGPCVNERAAIANAHGAELLVSVHADGNENPNNRGMHIIVSTAMAGGDERRSEDFARYFLEDLVPATGMPKSNYAGGSSAIARSDRIAGLNLLEVPGVMLEMGNFHHPEDKALIESPEFRHAVASSLAHTIQEAL